MNYATGTITYRETLQSTTPTDNPDDRCRQERSLTKSLLLGLMLLLILPTFGATCQALSMCDLVRFLGRQDWSREFRRGPSREGFQDCEDAITLKNVGNLKVVWSDPTMYAASSNSSPAVTPWSLQNTGQALYMANLNPRGVVAYDANGIWGDQGAGIAKCPLDSNGVRNCGPEWSSGSSNNDSLFGSSVAAYPAFSKGVHERLVFFAGDRTMSALDAASGAILWSADFGLPSVSNWDDITSSPVYDNNTVYVGGKDGYLYAFDAGGNAAGCPSACTPLWKSAVPYGSGHSIISSPAIVIANVGKLIAVGDVSNACVPDPGGFTLYYADDNNKNGKKAGDVYWHMHANFGSVSATPLVKDGKIYIVSNECYGLVKWTYFYATKVQEINPNVPAITWSHLLPNVTYSSAAIDYQEQVGYCDPNNCHLPPDLYDILYIADGDQIFGFDLQSTPSKNQLVCQAGVVGSTFWSSPSVIKGLLFIGGSDGSLHGFDTSKCKASGTLTEVSTIKLSNSPIRSSPVIANGMIYVNTLDGLFAIK